MRFTAACLSFFLVASAEGAERSHDAIADTLTSAIRSGVARSIVSGAEVPIPVASGGADVHQSNPVIASDGESFLVVWRESAECCFWHTRKQTLGSLYATRLNLRGEPISDAVLVTTRANTARPGLAFDGTNYLLVWNEVGPAGPSIVGQRFSVEATPVDPLPFFVRFEGEVDAELAVACGESDCLTIFRNGHALISKGGTVLRSTAERGSPRNDLVATTTGYAATGTLVQSYPWSPFGQQVAFNAHAYTEFPDSESIPVGPFQITTFDSPWWERVSSSLATNGSLTIVAAVKAENLKPRELFIARVPSNDPAIFWQQRKLDVGLVDAEAPLIQDPEMVWTGKRFLLVFQKSNELPFSPAPGVPSREMTKAEIAGVWLDAEGSVEGPAFDVTSTDEIESLPAIAVNARGLMALAFVRGRGGEGSSVPRLFVKMVHDGGGRSRPARR